MTSHLVDLKRREDENTHPTCLQLNFKYTATFLNLTSIIKNSSNNNFTFLLLHTLIRWISKLHGLLKQEDQEIYHIRNKEFSISYCKNSVSKGKIYTCDHHDMLQKFKNCKSIISHLHHNTKQKHSSKPLPQSEGISHLRRFIRNSQIYPFHKIRNLMIHTSTKQKTIKI